MALTKQAEDLQQGMGNEKGERSQRDEKEAQLQLHTSILVKEIDTFFSYSLHVKIKNMKLMNIFVLILYKIIT